MQPFELSKTFPNEERSSLVDQMRRSSRSVSANIAEAWRKRRYEAAFVAKLSDSEAGAAETQVWIQYCVACGDLSRELAQGIYTQDDEVIAMLVTLINRPGDWCLPQSGASLS